MIKVVELWLHIVGEVELVVNHHLLGLPGFGYKDVTILQALEQCEIMLDKLGVVKASTVVTAGAAQVSWWLDAQKKLANVSPESLCLAVRSWEGVIMESVIIARIGSLLEEQIYSLR
ncbi:hypothetical protein Tco_0158786 [Tanacetum coccineum]